MNSKPLARVVGFGALALLVACLGWAALWVSAQWLRVENLWRSSTGWPEP
mgnify:CR=1 FL=1